MTDQEQQREQERAAFAYKLAKFQDREGNTLPATEEGIVLHQAAVEQYRAEYGGDQSYAYFYDGIRQSLGLEREADAREERIRQEYADSQTEQAEKLEAERARVEAESARRHFERSRADAERIMRIMPNQIASCERQLERHARSRKVDQERVDDLTPKLETDEYKRSSVYQDLLADRDDSAARVQRSDTVMIRLRERMAGYKERVAWAHEILDTDPSLAPIPNQEPPPSANFPIQLTPGEDQRDNGPPPVESAEWSPIWNKAKYEQFLELQNIPDHWQMSKVVLIWRGQTRQDLRVFSLQPNGYQTMALIELAGSGDLVELSSSSGDRWDFELTRAQYDKAAG